MRAFSMTLFALALLVSACSKTAPEPVDVTGTWYGSTCAPMQIDSCAIELRLTQTGTSITGTYNYTTIGGTVEGTVSGSSVSMTFTYPATSYSNCVAATVSGNEMVGTLGCGSQQGQGKFDVKRD